MSIVTIPNAVNASTSFTPTLTFGGGATGMTFTSRVGAYIKIGSLVFFKLDIFLSAKGSSTGTALLGALPFSAANDVYGSATIGYADALSSITGQLTSHVIVSSTTLGLNQVTTGTLASLTHSNFSNTSRLIVSGMYSV